MYYFTKWDVLIVDDEPDVLMLSRQALEDMEVYGLPLALHTAHTRAEAVDLLHNHPDLSMVLALAFLDVALETDTAGLELCTHIREEIGNRATQIFVRTGQSGAAPEKAVVDQYEINGYWTRLDTDEEKLYCLVKSGVRQFLWSHTAQLYLAGLNEILAATRWRQKIEQLLVSFLESAPGVVAGAPLYIAFDGAVLVQHQVDAQQVARWRQKLDPSKGVRLALAGAHYVHDEENQWGITIAAGPANVEVVLFCHTAFTPPEDLVAMTHDLLQSLAILWRRGG